MSEVGAEGSGEPAFKLHCLGGRSPAREIVDDLGRLGTLPPGARARFWDVLGPSLAEPLPREVEGVVRRFAEVHGADGNAVARAVRAARVLVRAASVVDLDAKRFCEDLTALAGGTGALVEVLLPGYERGKARVQAEVAQQTVADHGRLLESVRWRVDMMSASDRGMGLRLPLVTLTLHYREAGRREQLSLQVLPDVLKQLRGVCDRVLGRG